MSLVKIFGKEPTDNADYISLERVFSLMIFLTIGEQLAVLAGILPPIWHSQWSQKRRPWIRHLPLLFVRQSQTMTHSETYWVLSRRIPSHSPWQQFPSSYWMPGCYGVLHPSAWHENRYGWALTLESFLPLIQRLCKLLFNDGAHIWEQNWKMAC